MRCGCPRCGAYMVQQESGGYLGCRCPACDYRCDACMGTDTVLSRDEIARYQVTGGGRLDQIRQFAEEDTEAELLEETEDTWMNDYSDV